MAAKVDLKGLEGKTVTAKRLGWDESLTAEQEFDLEPFDADSLNLRGRLKTVIAPAVSGFPGVTVYLVGGQEADGKTIRPA